MHEELDSMLPWYANDTLSGAERAVVARQLLLDPGLRQEMTFWQEAAIHQRNSAGPAAEDIGLLRTLERIRRESNASSSTLAGTPGIWAARAWSRWFHGQGWLRPAFACALLVVVAQSAVMLGHRDQPVVTYRGAAPAPKAVAHEPLLEEPSLLRVEFAPATTEGEIRLLLASQGGWIVGGPGNGGEYYIAVPRDKVIVATDALRANPAIRDVAAAASVPRPE